MAFKDTGIVALCARAVLNSRKLQAPLQNYSTEPLTLERTPYTKCELRQQTTWALNFVKTASEGDINILILRFSHTAEYALTEKEMVIHDMVRLRNEIKLAHTHKQDLHHIKGARVLKGEKILPELNKRDEAAKKKAEKKDSKKAKVKEYAPVPVTPKRTRVRFVAPKRVYYSSSNSSSCSSSLYSTESTNSSSHYRPSMHPRVEPTFNTPQNPNRWLPDCPLGMSLCNRT
ncbi:hypothetical protein BDD12DRAFT_800777 [Trichophaea hybrida]|nr:hypothetical protein BDD12DRAFT_800777 [Trichophaea hybrida]